jgi:hypothetical protein
VLAEWGLGHLEDAVVATLSELVANAVVATEKVAWSGGRPPVRLWLLGGPGSTGAGQVMICVWDAVRELPVPREAQDWDESGRGLGIVGTLSGRHWDCYLAGGPEGGKITRAAIDHPWRE